jgi:hypothetical protein
VSVSESLQNENIRSGLARMLGAVASLVIALALVAVVLGIPTGALIAETFTRGPFAGLTAYAGWLILLVATVYIVWQNDKQASFPFVLSAVALWLIITEFLLPASVVSLLPPVDKWLGIDLAQLDALQVVVYAIISIVTYWAITERLRGEYVKKPQTIANRIRKRSERLADIWAQIGREAAFIGFGIVLVIVAQMGVLLGLIGERFAEVPGFAAAIATSLLGFVSLGGGVPILSDIPFLNELGAVGYAVLALVIIGLAAAVYNQ